MGQSNCCSGKPESYTQEQSKEALTWKDSDDIKTLESKKSKEGKSRMSQKSVISYTNKTKNKKGKMALVKSSHTKKASVDNPLDFSEAIMKEYKTAKIKKNLNGSLRMAKKRKDKGRCSALVMRMREGSNSRLPQQLDQFIVQN
ncbi:unnamed protein product [Moneuplotes crassus]|uniref:Uncharacterized protein n=1 Tax=Euplotes crassus TaxID=5936 RepID=A0AAD1XDX6_EUPCR|nr:unnamed protein product [Moneuplotes crassus]